MKIALGDRTGRRFLAGSPASAGTITGLIKAKGPEGASGLAGDGNYSSLRYKFAERVDYDHLQDFVIFIDQVVPGALSGPPPTAAVAQHDVSFEPHVLPIAVGTKVSWPNRDEIYHNVFSISENASFDLGLYTKDDPAREFVFDRPGQVDVFCAIHTKMHCIMLVSPSPYIAKVDANRHYQIRDVPPGTYRLTAWHERLPRETKQVTVPAQGDTVVDFVMGPAGLATRKTERHGVRRERTPSQRSDQTSDPGSGLPGIGAGDHGVDCQQIRSKGRC